MEKRHLNALSLALAGITTFSLSVSAATDSLKRTTPMETSAPAPLDSVGKRKSPAMGQATTNPGTTTPGATTPGTMEPGATMAATTFTDAEIIGMVNTVDKHEIEAANKALKEKMSAEASSYAKMLKEQHTANLAKTKKLGKTLKLKAETNQATKDFRAKGEAEVKALGDKDGAEFERAYIDAMVNGHTEVLQMIDSQLIPNAQNESLKSHLAEVRGHVSAHLEQGKRLQENRASQAE